MIRTSPIRTAPIRTRRAVAAAAVAALTGALVTTAVPAHAAPALHHRHWYEVQASFTQNAKANTIAFTSRDYRGNSAKHSRQYTATDHFACVVGSGHVPICDGQLASGNSMLLFHGRGGQGSFDIPIVGGTGAFSGAHGQLHVQDLDADGARSNLTATYRR